MDVPVSPLAPAAFPQIAPISGVRLGSVASGIKPSGKVDLTVVVFPEGTSAAGVFTQGQVQAAPVKWCRSIAPHGVGRALVINSGVANAFTGEEGDRVSKATAAAAAKALGVAPEAIWICSTGVIGKQVPLAPIEKHLPGLIDAVKPDGWHDAARGIMTTDTFPKGATRDATIDGKPVRLAGMSKGAGMIAPNMATLLGFAATDAKLSAAVLRALLVDAVAHSFNAITVDGDTSTNDTILAFATGGAGNAEITDPQDPRLESFRAAFNDLLKDLALQVACDGEGMTKLVHVKVEGAASQADAKAVARAIAESPLVKTAIAGGDPNWGRICMAAGKSGIAFKESDLEIVIGGEQVTRNGAVIPGYDLKGMEAHLKGQEINILVRIGQGAGSFTMHTCDLTHGYITCNADYTT
jgi:glutamate N-acetyltransferase/amino-acid N-acetyltransferase